MKPLDRRGFLIATLGSLASVVLLVIHSRRLSFWSEWLVGGLGVTDPEVVFLVSLLGAGIFVVGLWCWFVARRFQALGLARWQAMLPFLFWGGACGLLVAAFQHYEPFDLFAGERPLKPGSPGGADPFGGGDGSDAAMRKRIMLEYLTLSSLGAAAMAILAATWCAAHGLRRDPVPIGDHFA